MMNKKGKAIGTFGVIGIILLACVFLSGTIFGLSKLGVFGNSVTTPATTVTPTPTPSGSFVNCNTPTAYTYSAVDVVGTVGTVGGTDEIKVNGAYPATSLASPKAGASLQYWKSNATVFVKPKTVTTICGSDAVQADAWVNGSITTKIYDTDNAQFLTAGIGGATNFTIGANGQQHAYISYQSTAKKANMPFGGCLAVEVPTTITSVSPSYNGVALGACPYVWTYSVASTSNTYTLFAIPDGWDANGVGDLKKIDVTLNAGSSDPSGIGYVTFQPANYYISNAGTFELGIQKDKNADTTKTQTGYSLGFGIN